MELTKECFFCGKTIIKTRTTSLKNWNRQKLCSISCANNFSKGKHYKHPKALNKYCGKVILRNGEKLCCACKKWKPLSEFHKRNERPMGVKPKCKQCEQKQLVLYKKTIKGRTVDYKSGARQRNLEWNLSEKEFASFWKKPCYYCGDEIDTIGLDRIDNNKGYDIVNVISCCRICNIMKMSLEKDFFITHCKKIAKRA